MAKDRFSNSPHRRNLEAKLGRKLMPNEVSDHVDEDKNNNAPANLRVMTRGAHTTMHAANRPLSKLRASLRMVRDKKRLY